MKHLLYILTASLVLLIIGIVINKTQAQEIVPSTQTELNQDALLQGLEIEEFIDTVNANRCYILHSSDMKSISCLAL